MAETKTKKKQAQTEEPFQGITGYLDGPHSLATSPWEDDQWDQFSLYRVPSFRKYFIERGRRDEPQ